VILEEEPSQGSRPHPVEQPVEAPEQFWQFYRKKIGRNCVKNVPKMYHEMMRFADSASGRAIQKIMAQFWNSFSSTHP
jgi:hypothetical protein